MTYSSICERAPMTPSRAEDRKSTKRSPRRRPKRKPAGSDTRAEGAPEASGSAVARLRDDDEEMIMSSVNGGWLRLSLYVPCTAVAALLSGKLLAQVAEGPDLSLELIDPSCSGSAPIRTTCRSRRNAARALKTNW